MLTPWFKIEQEHAYIIILIKAKHVKISADSEPVIHIGDFDFKFYCKPYYLRLHFSNQLVEDGEGSAEYENGFFRVKVPKLHAGEEFSDLNMLTKLLTHPGKTSASAPSIEAIDDEDNAEEHFDWHVEQTVTKSDDDEEEDEDKKDVSLSSPKYGFANTRKGVFKNLQEHLWDVIDLEDADGVSEGERRQKRMKQEEESFDDDHYLADLYNDEHIQPLIAFQPEWLQASIFHSLINDTSCDEASTNTDADAPTITNTTTDNTSTSQTFNANTNISNARATTTNNNDTTITTTTTTNKNATTTNTTTTTTNTDITTTITSTTTTTTNAAGTQRLVYKFTAQEQEELLLLPRKCFLLDKRQKRVAYLALVDILLAFAYDHRTTQGDPSVESGWTISKLSSTLSWLDVFADLRSVLVAFFRRSLSFPLHRHFALSLTLLSDVACILGRGREYVIRCMLQVRRLLLRQDDHYLLNQLYIDDYCLWLQGVKKHSLQRLAEQVAATTISKEEVGLDLPELEMAAELVLQEEEERKKMKKKMVRVNECDDDTDDEFESSSDSDDEIDEKGETDEEDDDDDEEEKVNKETLSDGSCVGRCDTSRQHEVDKCAHEMTRLNL